MGAYEEAVEDARNFHKSSKTFSGSLAFPHRDVIKGLIDRHGCRTVLDYGCGKCLQYTGPNNLEEFWGVEVTKWDPAIPGLDFKLEGKWDLVICTHSLGCVPIADMNTVIDQIYGFADKAVYFGEYIGKVKKRIFRRPWRFAYEWDEGDWFDMLRRDEMPIEVILGVLHEPHGPVKTIQVTD